MEAPNNANIASVGEAPHDLERATASLVLGFDTDPFMRWMYDGPDGYLRGSAALFRVLVADARAAGGARAITSDGRSAGTALWLPPGAEDDDAAIDDAVRQTVEAPRRKVLGELIGRVYETRPATPHWYLSSIGIDPAFRDQGLGGRLLAQGLQACDAARLPAWLWSSNPRNLDFYGRHGFEVLATIRVGDAPPLFPMLRAAR